VHRESESMHWGLEKRIMWPFYRINLEGVRPARIISNDESKPNFYRKYLLVNIPTVGTIYDIYQSVHPRNLMV
jgi:hypothetical protein